MYQEGDTDLQSECVGFDFPAIHHFKGQTEALASRLESELLHHFSNRLIGKDSGQARFTLKSSILF